MPPIPFAPAPGRDLRTSGAGLMTSNPVSVPHGNSVREATVFQADRGIGWHCAAALRSAVVMIRCMVRRYLVVDVGDTPSGWSARPTCSAPSVALAAPARSRLGALTPTR
jgi:hypothetical protein